MINTDGTTGGNSFCLGQVDDQQMITSADRENYIARLTQHFGGNREMAKHLDDQAITRSGGKAVIYKKVLQMLLQSRNQQIQQQQQQQSMMNIQQQQQQQMYMSSQQPQQPSSSYTMQPQLPSTSASMGSAAPMMNVKQEPQTPMPNVQMRPHPQNYPIQQQQQQQIKQESVVPPIPQQQQQIKQELMVPPIPQQQQQVKQELMIPPAQQQTGMQAQQMRQQVQQPSQYGQQQLSSLTNQTPGSATPQQRTIVQHLQQVRQQNHLSQQQQQQQEFPNSIQMQQQQQQQQQPSSSSALPQSSSPANALGPSTTPTSNTSGGSSDEILQQLLTSPNPPKQPTTTSQNAAQARLRTINRTIRNQSLPPSQLSQQQPSPMTPGADPMMIGSIPSPHSYPGMMQQPQTPMGLPGQSPLPRYMMPQSPQPGVYRPQMSPMNMMNYAGSPTAMIDEEMHYLLKFFTDRIHYLTRVMTRYQQEGQHDKVAKYRQLHDQMATFVRNPIPEHLMAARRLKEHVDRLLDPRIFGPVMMPPMMDMTGMMVPSGNNAGRLMANGIFEQCQRAVGDYLSKDTVFRYNVFKRFLEPLSEVLNGVPYRNIRLDTESKQSIEPYLLITNSHPSTSLVHMIENEFANLSLNTFAYELKPLSDKISSSSSSSISDQKDTSIRDYELTCRFIEINMPVVPPLKMKITVQYPHEPPEVLSLSSTTLSLTPAKLENSDGHSFFETISRNFIYFLFKLPTQHTVTDILDIWRTAIRSASLSQQQS